MCVCKCLLYINISKEDEKSAMINKHICEIFEMFESDINNTIAVEKRLCKQYRQTVRHHHVQIGNSNFPLVI